MSLVGKPTHESNIAERLVADAHEMACMFNPAPNEIGMRSLPKGLFERAGEVRVTALCNAAQIRDQYAFANVRVDVLANAASLPGEQRPANAMVATRRLTIDFDPQQRGGPGDGGFRGLRALIELHLCNIE